MVFTEGIFLPVMMVTYLVIMLSGYLIYRRGFKFKIPDIVVTALGFALPFAVAYMNR